MNSHRDPRVLEIFLQWIRHHTYNIEKAKHLLDWSPNFTVYEALQNTIDWFIESGVYNAL